MTINQDSIWDTTISRREFLKMVGASATVFGLGYLGFGVHKASAPPGRPIYNVLIVGDSIMWGQGLREEQKFYALAADNFRNNILRGQHHINANVVRIVRAHSGATIGVGDNTSMRPINGEVPTNYSTILQQVGQPARVYHEMPHPDTISLVLVNGGINDIGVDFILNPTTRESDIVMKCQQFFLTDMVRSVPEMGASPANCKQV